MTLYFVEILSLGLRPPFWDAAFRNLGLLKHVLLPVLYRNTEFVIYAWEGPDNLCDYQEGIEGIYDLGHLYIKPEDKREVERFRTPPMTAAERAARPRRLPPRGYKPPPPTEI